MTIHEAKLKDAAYLADACVALSEFVKARWSDLYIDNLPLNISHDTAEWVRFHIKTKSHFAFIAMNSGQPTGCILGHIGPSNLPIAMQTSIGHISLLWVDETKQHAGIGQALVAQAEAWLRAHGIQTAEVSYFARNDIAKTALSKYGFQDFRNFAYKQLI